MNSINDKSVIKTLEIYLSQYKYIFYKRSFENFKIIIIALLYVQGVRSINFIYDKFIKKYWSICLNRFYYFLAQKNFDISRLAIATLNVAISLIPNKLKNTATIYLIVDDTLQAKFGEKFDCYGKLFDHTSKNGTSYLNGHCFVSLAIAIPVMHNNKISYIKIPIQYRLYDKSKTKLEVAADMVIDVAPALAEYQVVVTCDSWYTKAPFISSIKKFENINIIGALRSDTAMFDLNIEKTHKRGRPRKRGKRIDYHNLEYKKDGKFFVAHIKVAVNLIDTPVYITITTTDIVKFTSVRLYMSTIVPNEIHSFDNISIDEAKTDKLLEKSIYNIYKIRWNIETIFYQQKTFWSLGNYMVRSKEAINKYVNLLGVAYSLTILLPFISSNLYKYKFQSPQEVKYHLSECIYKEFIFSKLLKTLQLDKNITTVEDIFKYLADSDQAS